MLSKEERADGYRPVPQPTPREVSILRRVSTGFLLRTNTDKGERFVYDDGVPVQRTTTLGDRVDDHEVVQRMIACGFLIGIPNETLPGIPRTAPQRYRARTIEDGPLPKFEKRA